MSWITPVIDWDTNDGIMDSDFNRIEGDVKYLYDQLDAGETVEGVFNSTLSGYASPPSIAIRYRISHFDSVYNLAQLWFPSVTGTSNSNSMELVDQLPVILRNPLSSTSEYHPVTIFQFNAGEYWPGAIKIIPVSGYVSWLINQQSSGSDPVSYDDGTSFYSAGSKVFFSTLVSYLIPKA